MPESKAGPFLEAMKASVKQAQEREERQQELFAELAEDVTEIRVLLERAVSLLERIAPAPSSPSSPVGSSGEDDERQADDEADRGEDDTPAPAPNRPPE